MLATKIFGRCIGSQFVIPVRRLHISRSLFSNKNESSSSSESSDSSDSDQDVNKATKQTDRINETEKTPTSSSDTENELYNVLQFMMKKNTQNTGNIKPRTPLKKSAKSEPPVTYEENLQTAAEGVADTLGKDDKDKDQIKWTLLNKLTSRKDDDSTGPLNNVISDMKVEIEEKPEKRKKASIKNIRPKYPVHDSKYNTQPKKNTMNTAPRVTATRTMEKYSDILYNTNNELNIFRGVKENIDSPKLPTWDALENKLLHLTTSPPPANAFQEMIKWTEEGKLWKFPIDNEQGMEKEHSVHFSEHVFLERHLIGWCPQKGPIRHFMELVCVGLSKNPYMTVEEKMEHIMWYKQYFADKESLLKEIGALDVQEQIPPELT